MDTVESELGRVSARQRKLQRTCRECVSAMLASLDQLDGELRELARVTANGGGAGRDDAAAAAAAAASNTVAQLDERRRAFHDTASSQQKELNGALTKYTKAVDKALSFDLKRACRGAPLDRRLLECAVAEHLFREGEFTVGDLFTHEAGLKMDPSVTAPFVEMHRILDALHKNDLTPAVEWARRHRRELAELSDPSKKRVKNSSMFAAMMTAAPAPATATAPSDAGASGADGRAHSNGDDGNGDTAAVASGESDGSGHSVDNGRHRHDRGTGATDASGGTAPSGDANVAAADGDPDSSNAASELEFKLHRLHFINLLQRSELYNALMYARQAFPPFAAAHAREIQQLMACFAFVPHLAQSPYAALFTSVLREDVEHTFRRDCWAVLGVAVESPLNTVVSGGARALPTLIKAARLMSAKDTWTEADELPVEVDLGRECKYHSIFVCPVSRDQSTAENPPMLLPCGHVLCKQTIARLPRGGTRFKCPYCPSEQQVAACREVRF